MRKSGTILAWPLTRTAPHDRPLDLPTIRRYGHGRYLAEAVPAAAMSAFREAWTALVANCLEPNVFLEPGFALPALQHFYVFRRPSFLLVWDNGEEGRRSRLIGLLPVYLPRFGRSAFARATVHKHAALGTPLLDSDQAREGLDMMLDWLAAECPHATGLLLARIPKDGGVFKLVQERVAAHGGDLRLFEEHERAVLSASHEFDGLLREAASPKKVKELRRQKRRLADGGEVTYRTARDPGAIRKATETFLVLEAQGWKGRSRTALLSLPELTIFTRTMTRLMAAEGKCRIDSLMVGERPVAMGIVLESGPRAHFWKTAYDESFRALSPGVHLTLELTQTQLADPGVQLTDSCAIADHPMINWVWPDRMLMTDLFIPLQKAGIALSSSLWRETAWRWVRQRAKATAHRILRRSAR